MNIVVIRIKRILIKINSVSSTNVSVVYLLPSLTISYWKMKGYKAILINIIFIKWNLHMDINLERK